jgi:cytochrome c biogenesis protein CcmG/thiol:disulfide interchange protein DsbE
MSVANAGAAHNRRPTWWRVLAITVIAGALAVGGYGALESAFGGPAPAVRPIIGQRAPTFRLPTLSGTTIRLQTFRGRPVILNFWATWCPYCRQETPLLQAVAARYGKRIAVLAVDVEDPRTVIARYVHQVGVAYPVLLDRAGRVATHYDVHTLPTTVFITARGRIAAVRIGPFAKPKQIDRTIDHLLTRSRPAPVPSQAVMLPLNPKSWLPPPSAAL